ncbi:MAG: 6-bladed beta-propeller [Candidatus Aminicenantes bacterium]|nr:MAG: 6-bladed beta-propeller [Candidatus Aminicenantes bacterium]
MKKPLLFTLTFALSVFTGFVFPAGQKVEFINNPAEPLHGEITLDLEEDLILGNDKDENYLFYRVWDIQADAQGNIYVLDSGATRIQKYDKNGKYLQTIGRKGQGPGEFERPIMLTLDKDNNLYVGEMAKIHKFDLEGKFIKMTKIPFFYMNFTPDDKRNFVVTGRIIIEGAHNLGVLILDSEGEIRKKIAEFPGLPMHETGTTISHDYSPELRFAAMGDNGFVYGYNMDYKLYIADWSGKNIIIFDKEEHAHTISRKEKNKIIDDLVKNTASAQLEWPKSVVEKMANLPHHRPFFDRIRVDDKRRIFIRQRRSVLDESEEMSFDVFGNDGHYLYSTKLPFVPMSIRDGFMYHTTYSEETGEVKVIRYRVKNWDQLASSLI